MEVSLVLTMCMIMPSLLRHDCRAAGQTCDYIAWHHLTAVTCSGLYLAAGTPCHAFHNCILACTLAAPLLSNDFMHCALLSTAIAVCAHASAAVLIPAQTPGTCNLPLVHPGHRNQQTVKGVSFAGASDEYVISGSDDGHIYLWTRNGKLRQWLEGDQRVVNCLEPHPTLPLVMATSGLCKFTLYPSCRPFGRKH